MEKPSLYRVLHSVINTARTLIHARLLEFSDW